MKVFIAGGVSYNQVIHLDNFPNPIPQTIHECNYYEAIGSTGSGKALNMSKLGFNVVLHALIGDDELGKKAIGDLEQQNLSFFYDIDPIGTERHLNIMNSNGERISIFINPASDNPGIDYGQFEQHMLNADYVVINLSNYTKKMLFQAKKLNKPIWTDLHDYDGVSSWHQPYVDFADYVFLSDDNLPDYRCFMKKMIQQGKKLVVVTHGHKGSTTLNEQGEWFKTPAISKFNLIDSNGAGDAYFSGFLYGHAKGLPIADCMKYGSIAGALAVHSKQLYHPDLTIKKMEEIFINH